MKDKSSFFILGLMAGALIVTLVFALKLGGFTGSGGAAARKVLKLAHGLESTHPVQIAMEKMKARLEELSGGEFSIDIYSGGPLGDEIKCIEQLKNGSLDMTKASTASVGMFVPQIQTMNMPYLFRDETHYWNVLNSPLGEKFLNFAQKEGLVGLCYYDAGARSFYTTKKQIKTPEDLVGLKIRVMNSSIAMDLVSCFGASPTPIANGELYTALAQGVVDGAENNFPSFTSGAHGEICKFFTVDEHTRTPDVLLISKKSWDGLNEKQKAWLRQAAAESSLIQRELWKKRTEEGMEHSRKIGVAIFTPDKAPFAAKTQKMYDRIRGTENGLLAEEIKNAK